MHLPGRRRVSAHRHAWERAHGPIPEGLCVYRPPVGHCLMVSIVLPTIRGRETELDRTIAAYMRLTAVDIEWIIERDHASCGAAWNAGVRKCTGDVVHIAADDLEPEHEGWWPAALACLEAGGVPLGWVREDELGAFGRDFCRVPIFRREWWVDVPEITYYSDNFFDDQMRAAGHEPTVAEGFDFYHRRSMVGRDESAERVERDRLQYLAAQ